MQPNYPIDTPLANFPDQQSSKLHQQSAPLLDHLIPLQDPEWALWNWFCIRGAGFPIELALKFADPCITEAANSLLALENEVEQKKQAALQAIKKSFSHSSPEILTSLQKLSHTLQTIAYPRPFIYPSDSDYPEVEAFSFSYTRLQEAWQYYQKTFEVSTIQTSHIVYDMLHSQPFLEAITWQNRQAIHHGIASLLHTPPEIYHQTKLRRKNRAFVAKYIQRYCTKNETIGFFGPVGWGKLTSTQESITVKIGPHLLADREVHFESWCIDALATTLTKDKRFRPWFIPRLYPQVYIDGTRLHLPFCQAQNLSLSEAAVLSLCDGRRTTQELVQELLLQRTRIRSEDEIYKILEKFCQLRRISWSFDVPTLGLYPEKAFYHRLQQIDAPHLRPLALSMLHTLELARNEVAASAGNAEQLDQALQHLEHSFTRLTSIAPTRLPGEVSAGRTLVYEDCLRDIDIRIGTKLIHMFDQPLTLMLKSARWLSYQIASRYLQAFQQAYDVLTKKKGTLSIPFPEFWLWVHPWLFDDSTNLATLCLKDFQQRWLQVLALSDSPGHVHYTSEELVPRIHEAFDVPGPGWRDACYHSPDIMLQATDLQEIEQGTCTFVLGEIHVSENTLRISKHPKPEILLQMIERDFPDPLVIPLYPKKKYPGTRTYYSLTTPKDFRLVISEDSWDEPKSQKLPLGSLIVEKYQEKLFVRSREKDITFDILDVFSNALTIRIAHCFKMFPLLRPHTPRITIDQLVIARESWHFSVRALSFAFAKTEQERFVAFRRWFHTYCLPRFLFITVPDEKPFFVDAMSPIFIEILAKTVRKQPVETVLLISEMLPTPDALWLTDAQGQHYTSEFRMVARDMVLPINNNSSSASL